MFPKPRMAYFTSSGIHTSLCTFTETFLCDSFLRCAAQCTSCVLTAGWVKAAQAMVFLAFFGSALAFAAGTCYLFVDAWNKKYVLYAFTAGSAVSGT